MSQLRKIRYRLFSWRKFHKLEPADVEIDVIIPVVEKDLRILPMCIEGVKRFISHKIKNIYIVSPECQAIVDFCKDNNLSFVDETTVFGFKPSELNLITDTGIDRSGWLFQQFVKLSGNIGTCRYYLCIDADHILIRPHVFLTKNYDTVFYMSYEKHKPYYDIISKILPEVKFASLSYVSHKMLFDKRSLDEMKNRITENGNGKPWQTVILENIDRSTVSGFSEFETYGNFLSKQVQRPWLQKRLKYKNIRDFDTLCRKYGNFRWSLTFPEYREEK